MVFLKTLAITDFCIAGSFQKDTGTCAFLKYLIHVAFGRRPHNLKKKNQLVSLLFISSQVYVVH